MAADVLMGNDQECGRWIRTYRQAPADGERGPPGQRTARPAVRIGQWTGSARADRRPLRPGHEP